MEKLEEFKKQFLADLPKVSMEKRGIEDPSGLIDQMVASMDKWKKLLSVITSYSIHYTKLYEH